MIQNLFTAMQHFNKLPSHSCIAEFHFKIMVFLFTQEMTGIERGCMEEMSYKTTLDHVAVKGRANLDT